MLSAEDIKVWNDVVNNASTDNPLCRDCIFRNSPKDCMNCEGREYVGDVFGIEEDDEWDTYDTPEDFENAPCDTYGPAACSSSCSNYARCMGWI